MDTRFSAASLDLDTEAPRLGSFCNSFKPRDAMLARY